jgi:DNA polymerase epsilon subunit 1
MAGQYARSNPCLINYVQTLVRCVTVPNGRAAVDLYFIEEDGNPFKATILYDPYFYVLCKVHLLMTNENSLEHK